MCEGEGEGEGDGDGDGEGECECAGVCVCVSERKKEYVCVCVCRLLPARTSNPRRIDLCILVNLVMHDSGQVSLEHLLLA